MSELSDLLRNLRGKMSLREASKKSGISHNYLSIVEKGIDPRSGSPIHPSPETLKSLSEAYDYPYEILMQKAGYIGNVSSEIIKDDISQKLLEEFKKLSKEDQEYLVGLMERMPKKNN